MDLSWLIGHTMFLTVHGSRAYGTNTASSDLDVKGICIPPDEVTNDLFQGFDQAENNEEIHALPTVRSRINPNNPKVESTIYSLRKFFKLAADTNPNIIELLYTDPVDWLLVRGTPWSYLHIIRDQFLSSQAKFRFQGYAYAQLYKIKRHRKWLLNPVLDKPSRVAFGLQEEKPRVAEAISREVKKLLEEWNFHQYGLDDLSRNQLKEHCWELVTRLCSDRVINWDNWPEEYWKVALEKLGSQLGLSEELTILLARENQYQLAVNTYNSYQTWLLNRNPERKVLEERFHFDTKHAKHLIRLLRMGYEIITGQGVIVKRPDAAELNEISNGAWSYEKVEQYADEMTVKIDAAYKTTKLPRSVNYAALDGHYHAILDLWRNRNN